MSLQRPSASSVESPARSPSSVDSGDHEHSPNLFRARYLHTNAPHNDRRSSGRPFWRSRSDSWVPEALGWFIALVSLAIILCLLAVFNNQPLSSFHSRLTLNTLLSGLAQLGQTALLWPVASCISQLGWITYRKRDGAIEGLEAFDQASRGLMGSVKLILKRPRIFLVYLGAVSTLLLLLFGPFVQQSVSFPLQETVVDAKGGSLPRTLVYQASHSSDTLQAYKTAPDGSADLKTFNTIVPEMKSAIGSGFSRRVASPSDLPATCSSGNCTFPDVSSLAVCSSVEDVSDTLVSELPTSGAALKDCSEAGCSYTVQALKEHPPWRRDNFSLEGEAPGGMWMGASELTNNSLGYSEPNTLIEFYMLYVNNSNVFSTSHPTNYTAGMAALKGTLSLCVKTYHTNTTHGQTNATLTDTQDRLSWKRNPSKVVNGTETVTAIETTDTGGTQYWIDQQTQLAFINYLSSVTFSGSHQGQSGTSGGSMAANTVGSTSDAATVMAEALFTDEPKGIEGVRRRLANIETVMSNAMRTTADNVSTVSGPATHLEIFISVDFRWLTAPIAAVVLALVFLFAVVMESRSAGIPAWKSSQTHALFALEASTKQRLESLPEDDAAAALVRLKRGDRWQLREGSNSKLVDLGTKTPV